MHVFQWIELVSHMCPTNINASYMCPRVQTAKYSQEIILQNLPGRHLVKICGHGFKDVCVLIRGPLGLLCLGAIAHRGRVRLRLAS